MTNTAGALAQAIMSMTGQGKESAEGSGLHVEVELRSLNNRHRDIHIRMSCDDFALEAALREQLATCFARGRIDCLVRILPQEEMRERGEFSFFKMEQVKKLATELEELARQLPQFSPSAQLPLHSYLPLLLHRRDAVGSRSEEALSEEQRAFVLQICQAAAHACVQARQAEGTRLAQVLRDHLGALSLLIQRMDEMREEQRAEIERRWRKKQEELVLDPRFSAERVAGEAYFYLERSDITEELQRLVSHEQAAREALAQERPLGRRLDFLCQEFIRELNTIGSKAQHSPLQHLVVEAKLLLEQIREQVQNLE